MEKVERKIMENQRNRKISFRLNCNLITFGFFFAITKLTNRIGLRLRDQIVWGRKPRRKFGSNSNCHLSYRNRRWNSINIEFVNFCLFHFLDLLDAFGQYAKSNQLSIIAVHQTGFSTSCDLSLVPSLSLPDRDYEPKLGRWSRTFCEDCTLYAHSPLRCWTNEIALIVGVGCWLLCTEPTFESGFYYESLFAVNIVRGNATKVSIFRKSTAFFLILILDARCIHHQHRNYGPAVSRLGLAVNTALTIQDRRGIWIEKTFGRFD